MHQRVMRRRELLKLSAATGAATLLAACLPETSGANRHQSPCPGTDRGLDVGCQ
jgi:hypothetical protein